MRFRPSVPYLAQRGLLLDLPWALWRLCAMDLSSSRSTRPPARRRCFEAYERREVPLAGFALRSLPTMPALVPETVAWHGWASDWPTMPHRHPQTLPKKAAAALQASYRQRSETTRPCHD